MQYYYNSSAITKRSILRLIRNLLEGSIVSWQTMEQELFRQLCNTQRCALELIKNKQREDDNVMEFIVPWRGLNFECRAEVHQQERFSMCLNYFSHDLSTTLMPQKSARR